MPPMIQWDTLTSIGPVWAVAVQVPPEPEVGFRGGFSLQQAIRNGEDITDLLPIEDKWELQLQAAEIADRDMPPAPSMPRPR